MRSRIASRVLRTLRQVTSHSPLAAGRIRGLEPLEQRWLLAVNPFDSDSNQLPAAPTSPPGMPSDYWSAQAEFAANLASSAGDEPVAGAIVSSSLNSVPPPGGLVLEQTADGSVDFAGDESVLPVSLDAGQTLTVLVVPAEGSSLRPEVEVLDPSSASLGLATEPSPGAGALLQTVASTTAGTYEIHIRGADLTTGSFQVRVIVNSALEAELPSTNSNDALAGAEPIDASFIDLGVGISRGAVQGSLSLPPGAISETEPNDDGIGGFSALDRSLAEDASQSWTPLGGNAYQVHLFGTISAPYDADWDFYRIDARPGDTLTLYLNGLTMGDSYVRLFDTFGNQIAADDDSGGSGDSFLAFNGFNYTGDYYIVADSYNGYVGTYELTATLTTSFAPPLSPGADTQDYFSFDLSAGESVSLAIATGVSGTFALDLYDASNTLVATGVGSHIDTFVAPASGTYKARISLGTTVGGTYQLIATRGAAFDLEPNDSPETAQEISGNAGVLGSLLVPVIADGSGSGADGSAADPVVVPDNADWYRIAVQAGDELEISTSTPFDGPGGFENLLDPAIELYDPEGNLVAADDNSAADGRNALLSATALVGGTYSIKVSAVVTGGEYVLHIAGASGESPAPAVIDTLPADGSLPGSYPTNYTLQFSELLTPGSVDATDLLIGGLPALSVEMLAGDTYRFTVDSAGFLGDGIYTVVLAGGVLTDLQGTPNSEFVGSFAIDQTGPRMIGTSWNGAPLSADHLLAAGPLTFTATFDEDLSSNAQFAYYQLYNGTTGNFFGAISTTYDQVTRQYIATYGDLTEGSYSYQLYSGFGYMVDLAGNALDGEPYGPNVDGSPTGDGFAGGNYLQYFTVDAGIRSLDGTWQRVAPNGSLIYSTQTNGIVSSFEDQDGFDFDLEGQQTLTAAAYPSDGSTTLQIRVVAPDNSILASATGAPGQPVSLQNVAIPVDGRYRVDVIGDVINSGYSLRLLRNAGLETVDDDSTAISLDDSFNSLGSGEYAVVGSSSASVRYLSSLVWAVQPSSGLILKIDPRTGEVVDAFPTPDAIQPSNTHLGLSIAEGGQALLYINSDIDATKLYRLNPVNGSVLSVETVDGSMADGIGQSPVTGAGVEPDNYSVGTNLANVSPGVTLSGAFGFGTITSQSFVGYAPTGSQVFALNGSTTFSEGGAELEANFSTPVARVSIDVASDDSYDIGVLRAYSFGGELLAEVISDGLTATQSQTLTIDRPTADIAYIRATGLGGEAVLLDNLQIGDQVTYQQSIFLSHSGVDVHHQQGYSGPEQTQWATGQPIGAIGGDGTDRQFGFFADGYIHEFSSQNDTNSFLSTLPAPAADIEGLAFDGQWLYASTAAGDLYTLNPNTGAIVASTLIAGGGLYGLGARGTSLPEGYFYFYVNGPASTISADAEVPGHTLEEQFPGGLETQFSGYVYASIFGDTLTIYNSYLYLLDHPESAAPFGYTANLAGHAELAPGLDFSAAFRYLSFNVYGTTGLELDGGFAPNNFNLQTSGGQLDYALPGFFTSNVGLYGLGGPNLTGFEGQFDPLPTGYRITLPFDLQNHVGSPGQLDMDLGLSGQLVVEANLGVPTIPFELGDTDEYTLDLSGKTGHHIDVVLEGLNGADFSQPGTQVSLIAPDGFTVLATSSATPLGVDALNYDQGLLDFTIPTDGVYTIRVQTTTAGQYSLVVTDDLAFDTENNNSGDVPLRDLDGVTGAVGFLDSRVPDLNGLHTLSIDTALTYIDITGDIVGDDPPDVHYPLIDQLPGSRHVTLGGTVVVGLGPDSIYFPGSGIMDADLKAGPFLPGNSAADWAGKVVFPESFTAYGAIRNFTSQLVSGILPLAADGTFSAANVSVNGLSGVFEYEVPGLLSGAEGFTGVTANATTEQGLYEIVDGQIRVTIPLAGSVVLVEPTTGLILTFNLTGQVVATMQVPTAVDGDDDYTLDLSAGDQWTFSTDTPLDGLETQNTLDPSILIIGPDDSVVAIDTNSAADGKNARLTFTAPTAGTYRVVVRGEGGIGEYVLHATQDDQAPSVTDVEVSSTSWSSSFIDFLAASGQGDAGFSIPVGSGNQLDSLSWVNINQVKIAFDEDVQVEADDLSISGIAVANYGVMDFQYDSGAHVATWTLSQTIPMDSILLTLDSSSSGVKDLAGNALDGEWDNPIDLSDPLSSFHPSGDGLAGGDFQFIFNVVPGDVDNNDGVNFSDYLKVRSSIGRVAFGDEYLAVRDVDGNGGINFADALLTRAQIGSAFASLPPREPLSASAPAAAAAVDSYFANLAAGLAPAASPTVALRAASRARPQEQGLADLAWAAGVDAAVHDVPEWSLAVSQSKEIVGKLVKLAKR